MTKSIDLQTNVQHVFRAHPVSYSMITLLALSLIVAGSLAFGQIRPFSQLSSIAGGAFLAAGGLIALLEIYYLMGAITKKAKSEGPPKKPYVPEEDDRITYNASVSEPIFLKIPQNGYVLCRWEKIDQGIQSVSFFLCFLDNQGKVQRYANYEKKYWEIVEDKQYTQYVLIKGELKPKKAQS